MTCDVTPDDYKRRLVALLPPGPAFNTAAGTTMDSLLAGLGTDFTATHNRACQLTREVNPASTVEMLADWEAVAGPNRCAPTGATAAERRNAVVSKLAALGGQSREYFTRLAASFGYAINIIEYRPFRAGMSAAGDALTNDGDGDGAAATAWTHWWTVQAPVGNVVYFRSGIGAAGEPLASFGDALLECLINEYKPAHTNVIFQYL